MATAAPPLSTSKVRITKNKNKTTKAGTSTDQTSTSTTESTSTTSTSSSTPSSNTTASLLSLAQSVCVVDELTNNKDQYTGREWVTITNLPGYITTNLDRVRRHVKPRPGIGPTIACCLHHGLRSLLSHTEIENLLTLKEQIDTVDGMDGHAVNTVAQWFRAFPVGVDVGSMSNSRRQNIALPESVKIELAETASDLGLSSTSLAVLAITATLSYQADTIPGDADIMSRTVTTFLKFTHLRWRGGAGMLAALRDVERW